MDILKEYKKKTGKEEWAISPIEFQVLIVCQQILIDNLEKEIKDLKEKESKTFETI